MIIILYKLSNKRSVHNIRMYGLYTSQKPFSHYYYYYYPMSETAFGQKGKTRRETLYITGCILHRRQTAGGRT